MKRSGWSRAIILDALTSLAGIDVLAYIVVHRRPEIVAADELVGLPASGMSSGRDIVVHLYNSSSNMIVFTLWNVYLPSTE